ncbi:MAG: hypothetical protein PHT16_02440 [Candidatus Pacebacteria bacterium]|nr:hypothetical protein [Candidatus Paceibacterota bacterium]
MNNNIEIKKNILYTMIFIFAGLALFYVFILGNMVFNIVERRNLEKEMLSLSNEVGNLQVSYLAVSNSVDMNLSSSMGFKETKATFATRKTLGRSPTGEALGFNASSDHLGNVKFANNEI